MEIKSVLLKHKIYIESMWQDFRGEGVKDMYYIQDIFDSIHTFARVQWSSQNSTEKSCTILQTVTFEIFKY